METTKDVLFDSADKCALRMVRGVNLQRGLIVFDERLTLYQKLTDIAKELDKMGYMLVKTTHEPAKD